MLSVSIPYGRQCCCRNRLRIIYPVKTADAAGRILRMMGEATELQLVILENTKGESDLTLYITMTVKIAFISFEYKLLD